MVALLIWATGGVGQLFKPPTTYAVGDLTVDFGVPEGDPIFVESSLAPGDVESRDVEVTNDAATSRPVGIRGVQTALTDSFDQALEITISDGVTDLYGPVSLEQFFVGSTLPDFVPLSTLSSGESATYTIEVKFLESAGNEFQNQEIVFDLKNN